MKEIKLFGIRYYLMSVPEMNFLSKIVEEKLLPVADDKYLNKHNSLLAKILLIRHGGVNGKCHLIKKRYFGEPVSVFDKYGGITIEIQRTPLIERYEIRKGE